MYKPIESANSIIRTSFNKKIEKMLHDGVSLKRVAIAISGGPDSTCLLFLLKNSSIVKNVDILALVVNHNMRPEAELECKKTILLLRQANIHYQVLSWRHDIITSNIQAKARIARYNLLCRYCQINQIRYLFLGHHSDDKAETIMLNILRGTGIKGLLGIRNIREEKKVIILRPLLNCSKQQILDYLNNNNISYIKDRSNISPKFLRAQIRTLFINTPTLYNIIKKLNTLGHNAKRANKYLDIIAQRTFMKFFKYGRYGEILISAKHLESINNEILCRILNLIFSSLHNTFCQPVKLKSLYKITQYIRSNFLFITTLFKCQIIKKYNIYFFFKERRYIAKTTRLLIGWNIWNNKFEIKTQYKGLIIILMTPTIWSQIKYIYNDRSTPHEIIMSTPIIIEKERGTIHHIIQGYITQNHKSPLSIYLLDNIQYPSTRQNIKAYTYTLEF